MAVGQTDHARITIAERKIQLTKDKNGVVQTWDDTEGWLMLCPKRKDKNRNPMEPNKAELDSIRNSPVEVKKIRTRLSDVSWWMRILCQKIGTRANQDDKEVGKFFQGRINAVRLLDYEVRSSESAPSLARANADAVTKEYCLYRR